MFINLEFELRYLFGNTPWDSGVSPPELVAFIQQNPAGRAIEFGCGTGTNAITLARTGWQVVAIDSSWIAITKAKLKAHRAGEQITFIRADVASASELKQVQPPFELALDIGCYHALEAERRLSYAHQLPQLVAPAGTYLLYSFLDQGQEPDRNWPAEADLLKSLHPYFNPTQVERGHFRERPSAWFTFKREV